MENGYERMLEISRNLTHLESIAKLLAWDQQTFLPPAAATVRAEQRTLVARLRHDLLVSDELRDLLENLSDVSTMDSLEGAEVRELTREHIRQRRIPSRLVEELQATIGLARTPWLEARRQNRFDLFAPWLEKLVQLSREKASALGFEDEPYDALLEDYEAGLRCRNLLPMLRLLSNNLRDLTQRLIASGQRPDISVLQKEYDPKKLAVFANHIAEMLGFDFKAGRMDSASHSFCSGNHPQDVRLATGFNADNPLDSLFATIHEVGHGLYHQGITAVQWSTPIGRGASLGVHESQARWWENCLAHGLPFWRHLFPRLCADFPESLAGLSPEQFYAAINNVQPSLIRVEADEVTYNLHVAVRTELERALINGQLSVADLPNAWDEGLEQILGIRPPNHREGVLQDVHWSQAMFGYFPTYALGNIYAAQLDHRLRQDIPDLDHQLARGDFASPLTWMRDKIHRHGAFYPPAELIRLATGEPLNARRLVEYLEAKFLPLYGL